jgi:2-dehydro-3-deoxyphosphogluconate aldolase/(4S)-4-hydroxy-2-oxoglutarate aldolase
VHHWEVTTAIAEAKVVGIIRTGDAAEAVRAARAVAAGGINVLEVALTTRDGLDAIKELRDDDVLLGAGTVLDAATARLACLAGARFLVTPAVLPEVIETGHAYGVPVLPGAATPTEILAALRAGADLVKVFPAAQLGPGFVRAVRAALPQAPLVPTGGVDAGNAVEWLAAGAVAVGCGGALTQGSADDMTTAAAALRDAVAGLRRV